MDGHGQQGQSLARDAVLRCYESLATAVLNAARVRGYAGDDVQAAATLLATPDHTVRKAATLIADLWHEQTGAANHELAAQVAALPPGQAPHPALTLLLCQDILDRSRKARSDSVVAAIDSTAGDKLATLLAAALAEMGESPPGETPPHRLLALLVKRYRSILHTIQDQADSHRQRLADVFSALEAVVSGKTPQLRSLGDDAVIIEGLIAMLDGRAALVERVEAAEHALEACQRDLSRSQQRERALAEDVERLNQQGDEDQRLSLYRDAFAKLEAGEDPTPLLERIRDVERVFVISARAGEETLRLLDRALDNAAHCLQDLRKLKALTDDPKRFRPRLLGKSPYALRTLPGMLAACRDAAQDVHAYALRLRWVSSLEQLASGLQGLRPAMQEMVRLVADCREKAGDRVTMSLTVNMATVSGLASLPALLAGDLHSLARSRRGKAMAADLVPLCEELLASYHDILAKAGDELPELPEPRKRERPATTLGRYADHLQALSLYQETTFGEAEAQNFAADRGDRALLADRDLLRRACSEIAAMVDCCSELPGAPSMRRTALPTGTRVGAGDWQAFSESHRLWLTEAARYRLQIVAS